MENWQYVVIGGLLMLFGLVVYLWARRSKNPVSTDALLETNPYIKVCLVTKSSWIYLCNIENGTFAYKDGTFGPYRVDMVYTGTNRRKFFAFAQSHGLHIVGQPRGFEPSWK